MSVRFRFVQAKESDRGYVEALRREALLAHVERLTPWDDAKQARLFARTFDAADTRLISVDGRTVGCVAIKLGIGLPLISTFYIEAASRRKRLGTAVLEALLAEFDDAKLATRLTVLHGSGADRLYLRAGYAQGGCDKWQGFYVRYPKPVELALERAA